MKADELKWDSKYSTREYADAPNKNVQKFYPIAETGNALDIAAGCGRNSRFLSQAGYIVDAIDISSVGLKKIEEKDQQITKIIADLDFYELEPNRYDLIININYLQRRLFPQIIESLRVGGVLIFQTFTINSPKRGKGEPVRKDHLLRQNELLHSFLSLQVIYYEEKKILMPDGEKREIAVLVARKNRS